MEPRDSTPTLADLGISNDRGDRGRVVTVGILEQLLQEVRALRRELADLRGSSRARHVSVAEYAAARSISPKTVRAAISANRLPVIRAGRSVRVPADVEIAPVEKLDEKPTDRAERRLGIVNGGRR